MPIRFKRSLRFRGGLAFALFGGLLSLLLSGWLYLATHDAGLRLMDETLKAELEDYLTRRQRNPYSLPQATVTVTGYVSPSPAGAPPPPVELRALPPGLTSLRRITSYNVCYTKLLRSLPGRRHLQRAHGAEQRQLTMYTRVLHAVTVV